MPGMIDARLLFCLVGWHRPSIISIGRGKRGGDLSALCDRCGTPIERSRSGRWRTLGPIYEEGGPAA